MSSAAPSPVRGLRFALLAQPSVQLIRFATKAALAWFLVPDDYGPVALASLLAYLAAHLALLGLNEALVQAHRPGAWLWGHLQRIHQLSGAAVAALMVLVGLSVGWLTGDTVTSDFILALSPMVWLANLATLPTALLVREQEYARLFRIDVSAALALSVTTLGLAALGAGAWSVAGGLYANALLATIVARREAREFLPAEVDDEDPLDDVLRKGRHFCGAELLNATGEQADSLAVGFLVSRAALGLYSYALTVGQVMMNYTTSLAERSLFPILADRRRHDALGPAFNEALRVALVFVLPVHVLLASVATPLTALLFPAEWSGVGPLLLLLALACGARCIDIVGSTALKADGDSRRVAQLGVVRLAMLVVALAVAVPSGGEAVAAAVLVARVLATVVTLATVFRAVRPAGAGDALRPGCQALAAWLVTYPLLVWMLARLGWVEDSASLELSVLVALALGAWTGLRMLLDRKSLVREWSVLANRLKGSAGA